MFSLENPIRLKWFSKIKSLISLTVIFRIYIITLGKQKKYKRERSCRDERIAWKMYIIRTL